MKAGVFASPNRNLIYVRKDQTVACTTLYPSTWPGMKVRYSEKRDEVELCGYVFVRVADVPNGCTKPHLHLQDVAANLRVPYVHRDENGEPLKLQPFVAATIDAPYMKVNHHQFNEGPSFPSNGLVHRKTVTGRSVIATDPPPQNITRTLRPAYSAPRELCSPRSLGAPYGPGLRVWNKMVEIADAGRTGSMQMLDLPEGLTRDQAQDYVREYRETYPYLAEVFVGFLTPEDKELLRNQAASAEFGALAEAADKAADSARKLGEAFNAGGVVSAAEKAVLIGVARSEYLLPIDEAKHLEGAHRVAAHALSTAAVTVHGRPLHPQMKKVGITGLVVDPDKPEQMEAVNDLFAGRIALCSAKAARKHRKQGHRVWFHPLFKAYAWSKENVA